MSFSFSSMFSEAEAFISRVYGVASQVPAEVQAAAGALETAKAAATQLENALKAIAPASGTNSAAPGAAS